MQLDFSSDPALAARITRAASKQTYYTVRLLVDKNLVQDAYRAYAYFRWVDDCLDADTFPRDERLAFLSREQALVESVYAGQPNQVLAPEECLIVELIRRDADKNSGLRSYISNMMAVMAFDADRRGRLISQRELNDYTHWLAIAVTEALHYFIGHRCGTPCDDVRYQAATGAHIAHMLRDTVQDARAGYYNIPRELLDARGLDPEDVSSAAYRDWVEERARQARACFAAGRAYLAHVENLRCRIAGYAYIHRFEVVLDLIEREHYLLRPEYDERKAPSHVLRLLGWSLWMGLAHRSPGALIGARGQPTSNSAYPLPRA